MPRLTAQHHVASLALAAMLLLNFGPLLSQLLVPVQPAWLSELACHDSPEPGSNDREVHSHDPLWAKCGYCTLLFSSPALSRPAPLLALGGLARLAPVLPARPQAALAPWVYPAAYSRAPPVLS
jgi:hypothetical protein